MNGDKRLEEEEEGNKIHCNSGATARLRDGQSFQPDSPVPVFKRARGRGERGAQTQTEREREAVNEREAGGEGAERCPS